MTRHWFLRLYTYIQVVVDDVVSKVSVQVAAIKAKIYKQEPATTPPKAPAPKKEE